MAGWIERGGIWRHLCLSNRLELALVSIAICLITTGTYAQEGFLNIDCGHTGRDYVSIYNTTWTSDGPYIMSGNVSQSYQAGYPLYFRYFPEQRSKHCYEIPTPDLTYLIRAFFFLNVSDLANRQPFEFVVSINAQNWFTLTSGYTTVNETDFEVDVEGNFYLESSSTTNICLQPVVGEPFISNIQRVVLDPAMYSYSGWTSQYLQLSDRFNLGTGLSVPNVRYPDDQYDRVWSQPSDPLFGFPAVSIPTAPDTTRSAAVNYVPPQVMNDGWRMTRGIYFYLFFADNSDPRVYVQPPEYIMCIVYTENLDTSDSTPYNITVKLDSDPDYYKTITFSHLASMASTPNFVLSDISVDIDLGNYTMANGVVQYPILNALEIFGQHDFNASSTYSVDVEAIGVLKQSLGLTDWQGDPCTPVPHDWLACNLSSIFTITNNQPCGFNATAVKQCGVQESFLRSKYVVTALFLPNLQNNDLTLFTSASGNSSKTYLPHLTQVSMPNCSVDHYTFGQLIDNFFNYLDYLAILDLSYNNIGDLGDLPFDWGSIVPLLTSLNLSHNYLTGELNTLLDNSSLIQELDLSYNNLTSLPTSGENSSLSSLVVLDLSHNQFTGDISSLDELVMANSASLQKLIVSDNNLGGTFNSSLYLAGLPNLTTGYFDRNSIQGTLDLTTWYNNLKSNNSNSTSSQVFSFLNNSITSIIPNSNAFDMAVLQASNSTVLLGGNQYCNGANSEIQLYLCRFTLDPLLQSDHRGNDSAILASSIVGGVVAFSLCCIIAFILWKLRRQMRALREIQRALADQKVQPPFFTYSDLKMATKDFHKENRLGRGGFGVVYKGMMLDKTMLAIKQLFNSKTDQVLNEFLNEVVLITGIKHRNLVQLKGCCIQDKQRMLVYEYVEKGNLAEALWGSQPHGGLIWEQRFNICVGVARGLSYLHEELQPSIIHRDIKPENILLDANFRPKIADFGLARHLSTEETQAIYTQIAGSLGYLAPEYATEGQLSDKIDVYSYGILVLEVISGRKCIDNSLPPEQKFLKDWVFKMHRKGLLIEILQAELQNQCVEGEVIRAIKIGLLCVQHQPEMRPSMSEVVTMLLGNANIEPFVEVSQRDQNDFDSLVMDFENDLESSNFGTLRESDSRRLLRGSQSSASISISMTNSTPLELSSSREVSTQGSAPLIELSVFKEGR